METKFIVGKILISISTIIYGFIPPFFDLNKTHATNPNWTGHSRFHVVWQVMITFFISILALYLLWENHFETKNLVISFVLGLSVLGSFVLNIVLMNLYGGKLADKNGVSKTFNFNPNLVGFVFALILLILGFLLALL